MKDLNQRYLPEPEEIMSGLDLEVIFQNLKLVAKNATM